MVIIIIAEACVDFWVKFSIVHVTIYIVASVRRDHESIDEVVVEEVRHIHGSIEGVKPYFLILELFFDRWHIILDFNHNFTLVVVKGVLHPSS